MKLFDKILVVIVAVLMVLSGLFGLMLCLRWPITLTYVALTVDMHYLWALALVCILLLAVGIRLLFAPGADKRGLPTSALIRRSEIGGAYITLGALNSMVLRHCRANARVRDCKTHIEIAGETLRILVRISATPETVLPELSDELQHSIKEHIEQLSGITVSNVTVRIESTEAQAAPISRVS